MPSPNSFVLRLQSGALIGESLTMAIGSVDGDPLTDITAMEKVVFVMKGGEVNKNPAK